MNVAAAAASAQNMNPADVMKNASAKIQHSKESNNNGAEDELVKAKEKIKHMKHRVDMLLRQMLEYMATVKKWQQVQEQTSIFCAESIDPAAPVAKIMMDWSNEVAELNVHVTTTLSQMFHTAIMDPILKWLDEFKPLKGMLKDYHEARSSRDHYVKKMMQLRSQMAKGKVKMEKVQRNTRKLAGAMAEYKRLEIYTLMQIKSFYGKCRNNFIQVTARHAQFQERLLKDLNAKTVTRFSNFAKEILDYRNPLAVTDVADAAKLGAAAAKRGMDRMKGRASDMSSGVSGRATSSSVGSNNSFATDTSSEAERPSSISNGNIDSGNGFGNFSNNSNSNSNNEDSGQAEQKGFGDDNSGGGGGGGGWDDDSWGATNESQASVGTGGEKGGGMGGGGNDDDFGDWDATAANDNSVVGGNDDDFGDWGGGGSNGGGGDVEPTVPPLPESNPSPVFLQPPTRSLPKPARPPRTSMEDPFGTFQAEAAPIQQQNTFKQGQQQQQQQPVEKANPFLDFF